MERITRNRAAIMIALLCLVLTVFCVKLYSMQVVDAEKNENNITTYTTRTRVRATRGDILDTNGNVLVTNRASYDLVINHYVILNSESPNRSILELVRLCEQLGVTYTDHFPITATAPFTYTLGDYNAAWQGYFQTYLASRGNLDSDISASLLLKELRLQYQIPEDWSDEDARKVIGIRYELSLRNGITNLPIYVLISDAQESVRSSILELHTPGLRVEASTVRQYNTTYAAHILGYVGAMSSKQWEEYKQLGYEMDALVGQSGFEMAFEEYLHGTDGVRVDEVTKDGTVVSSYYEVEPKSGNNVEVTIDLLLQMAAEDALAKTLEELRDPAINTDKDGVGLDTEGGAVIVLNIKTGEVLACGSYPTFDLSTLFDNYQQILEMEYGPLLNRALNATYPPGSTYKMCMVIAGINNDYIDRETLIEDLGVFRKYQGFAPECLIYTNYGYPHGHLNCVDALKCSCNYFFYELADRMKIQEIDQVAAGLGLGMPTGVELGEIFGYRSNPDTKLELFKDPDQAGWYPADQVLTGIGQAHNKFTPMQLAVYVSTMCNQGVRYSATFLDRVIASDYSEQLYEKQAQILSTTHISDEAFASIREGMRKVASEVGGTAYSTFANYPIPIGAKTGTAETDSGSPNGAFVCFAPYDEPEIAIVVYGEKAGGGSRLAKVAKAILDVYFGIDDGNDDPFENQVG